MKTIYIEGNVGAGKSTFLNLLKERLGMHVLYEPHHLWQNVDGENLLQQFFLDQKRWGYSLQTYVFLTRLQQEQQGLRDVAVCFVERSIYSGRYCFAQNCFELGLMNKLEWGLYQKFWDALITDQLSKPTGFVYIRTPAQICYERIAKRNRQEEAPISFEYILSLEKKHDDWLLHKKVDNRMLQKTSVLTLDCSKNFEIDTQELNSHMQKIETFLKGLNV